MISQKVLSKLNDQVRKEFYSAYLYLSMEAYFMSLNLNGFAHWFQVQAQEERDHAMLIFNFINKAGGRITLQPIDGPQTEFLSIDEVLAKTLEHEQFVTASIYDIVDAAQSERDHKTTAFLQWFINEQVEEEENADANIRNYELIKGDGKGLMLLDREMAARIYTPVISVTPGAAQA